MNRRLKILFVVILVLCEIFCMSYEVFAASGKALVQEFDGDNTGGKKGVNTKEGEDLITKVIDPFLSVIRIIAIGIGIIMITFLGIKYMSAAPTEKASIKNQLITFTVGLAVVVAATTILQMIHNAVTNITKI